MHAVLQVLIRFPTSRALPEKFYGSHVGIVVFLVRYFKDVLIDLTRSLFISLAFQDLQRKEHYPRGGKLNATKRS
jgi:hypothetical protein